MARNAAGLALNPTLAWLVQARRFFVGRYFATGLRQALGFLAPAIVIISLTQRYDAGLLASVGAMAVAIMDQAGAPHSQSRRAMLGAVLLSTVAALAAGLLSPYSTALWVAIPVFTFLLSMMAVYGTQGALLAFVSLLILILSMRVPISPSAAWHNAWYSAGGGLFYWLYSQVIHAAMRHREEREAVAAALFATADYLRARARLYDIHDPLDTANTDTMLAQVRVTDAHQVARELLLRDPPPPGSRAAANRAQALALFQVTVGLLDDFLDTRVDFAKLRQGLADADVLIYAHDTLAKQADFLTLLAFNVAQARPTVRRNGVLAELRAIDFELARYREQGLKTRQPELYGLLQAAAARLAQATRHLNTLAELTDPARPAGPLPDAAELDRFLDHKRWDVRQYTSNLKLQSPSFRHAVRVACAALVAMVVAALLTPVFQREHWQTLGSHGYWILLTTVIVMKPAFVVTRERNGKRLLGTLVGCAVAVALFHVVHATETYLVLVLLAAVLGYAFIQINYGVAAMFITLLVLLAFHLVEPGSDALAGARLFDTTLGCLIALVCSYILPTWEARAAPGLLQALGQANQALLNAGLARLNAQAAGQPAGPDPAAGSASLAESALRWQLAQQNLRVAFGNLAASVSRMMREPPAHRHNLQALNQRLAQHHGLALQIAQAVQAARLDPARLADSCQALLALRQPLAELLAQPLPPADAPATA